VWRLLLILDLLLTPGWAFGQTNADDYFHAGAQNYIFGDKAEAKKAIDTGLSIYPTDEKLNAVARLLLRKDPENQNQSKNSRQNQKQNQDQKDQKNQQDQQQKSDQQNQQDKKDRQNQAQPQQNKDQQKQSDQAKAARQGQQDKDAGQDQQAAAQPAQMTLQQAQQMLDAQKDDEKVLVFSAQNQPDKPVQRKIKDW